MPILIPPTPTQPSTDEHERVDDDPPIDDAVVPEPANRVVHRRPDRRPPSRVKIERFLDRFDMDISSCVD